MSESERRRGYRYNRVLIETERVLDPQYADAVVFLSGAQIEMLRNVTQYLRRPETYATDYELGYYLTPTVEDYDSILAIVADLEETLMGNPNTIWGYNDTYSERQDEDHDTTGWKLLDGTTVPAGYIYVATAITVKFNSGTLENMSIYLHMPGYDIQIAMDKAPVLGETLTITGVFPLKEGQWVRAGFTVLTQPCRCFLYVSGYKMVVP